VLSCSIPATFPDGSRVAVTLAPEPPNTLAEKPRIDFPLVRTGKSGTWDLTNERIAEILDEEDVEAMKDMWNAPS
jgi:hypothetical protein